MLATSTRLDLHYERTSGSPDYGDAVADAIDSLVNALAADGWEELPRQASGLVFERTGDATGHERLTIAIDPA